MRSFLADLRYAARVLGKTPAFSLVVVAVLALGIGANTAVFSVVDAVLLRGLPFPRVDRLVMIWEKNPSLGALIGDRVPVALSNFIEWQKRATQFESVAGYEEANFNLTSGLEPERVQGARASANFFPLFGVTPRLGRGFETAGDDPENAHVAVVSDGFFRSHFGDEPRARGAKLTLNDIVYAIVGVLPPEFHLPATREGQNQSRPEVWVPYDSAASANPVEFNRRKLQVFGRLRDGVSLAQARAEMNTIAARLAEEDATQNAGFGANVYPLYAEDVGQDQRRNLLVLLATVGFVLLIAVANVANLMLTRVAARSREMSIRKALGANRGRLITQLLAESLLLSGAGVGLYGVLASLVTQRTQEIGIRMALGAQRRDVLGLVLREGARMVLLGVGIGLAAGLALSRYLSSLFFGVSPANAATYLEVGLLMLGIALVACLLPAWRALRVNPMISLRYE